MSDTLLRFSVNNNDDGTCYVGGVGQDLPVGRVTDGSIILVLDGENMPRKVTYIMGSSKKGWHVACKGTSRFNKGEISGELRSAE
jgi:hypothetical protein